MSLLGRFTIGLMNSLFLILKRQCLSSSRQFLTGISCSCSCRVAPTREFKKAMTAVAADDSWKPRVVETRMNSATKEAEKAKERRKLKIEAKKKYLAKKLKKRVETEENNEQDRKKLAKQKKLKESKSQLKREKTIGKKAKERKPRVRF